jgi:hypothetical protein
VVGLRRARRMTKAVLSISKTEENLMTIAKWLYEVKLALEETCPSLQLNTAKVNASRVGSGSQSGGSELPSGPSKEV